MTDRAFDLLRLATLGLLLLAMVAGCSALPPSPAVSPVKIEPVKVEPTTPKERDLLAKLDLTKLELAEALAAQERLERNRQELGAKNAELEAKLRNEAAEKQAAINRAEAAENARIQQEALNEQAKRDEAEAAAKLDRTISYLVGIAGIGAIALGGVIAIFKSDFKTGGYLAAFGTGLLLIATNLIALGLPFRICACIALALGLAYLAAHVIREWREATVKRLRAEADAAWEADPTSVDATDVPTIKAMAVSEATDPAYRVAKARAKGGK